MPIPAQNGGGADPIPAQGGGDVGPVVDVGGQAGAAGSGAVCCLSDLSWQTTTEKIVTQPPDANLLACSTYTRVRGDQEQCRTTLACSGLNGVAAVELALDNADVQAAMAEAPVFFGSDPRPTGGVLQINVNSKMLEVGADCADFPSCVAPPPGVAALASLLNQIEAHELSEPACASRCPQTPYFDDVATPCSKYGMQCRDVRHCAITCTNGFWTATSPVYCDDPLGSQGGRPDQ